MIIVIGGPTGVGKTKLSIMLAKKYNCEIINYDSMQVYKEFNIASAKIKENEKEGIKHHLLDVVNYTDSYNVFRFQKDSRLLIEKILKKNKNVILVGGTGLYVKAALYDYKFNFEPKVNEYNNLSTSNLYEILISKDKNCDIDKNNRKRIIRALNYFENNKKSISLNKDGDNLLYKDVIFIGLTTSRELLYDKINNRVDSMIKEGLISEAKDLYNRKIISKSINTCIGYKELFEYFNNQISLDLAVNNIKKRSRNYAKRQYTFFNNKLNMKWFDVDYKNFNETYKIVSNYINEKNRHF